MGQVRLPPSIGRTGARRALRGLQSMCASKCWAVSCPSEGWGAGPAVHLLTSPSVVPGPLTPGATSDAAEVIGLRGLLVRASAPSTTRRAPGSQREVGGRQDQPRLSLVVAEAGDDRLWQGGRCQRTMSCAVPSPYPDVSTRRVPPVSPLLPAHACCHHNAHSPSEAPPSLSELQALSGGGGGRWDWPAVGLDSETSQPRSLPAQDMDDLHPGPCHPTFHPHPPSPSSAA